LTQSNKLEIINYNVEKEEISMEDVKPPAFGSEGFIDKGFSGG